MEALWPHTVSQQAAASSFSRRTPKVKMCWSDSQTWGFTAASLRQAAPLKVSTTSLHQRRSFEVLSYTLDDYDEGSVPEPLQRRSCWCLCPAGSFVSRRLQSTIIQIFNHKKTVVTFLSLEQTVTDVDSAFERFSNHTNGAAEVIYPAFSAAGVCGSICSGLSLSLMVLALRALVRPQTQH